MFFTHERGRMVAIYIFFQQLGSILGLILGGYISDGIGWRWSSPIVAIACVCIRFHTSRFQVTLILTVLGCSNFIIHLHIRRYHVPKISVQPNLKPLALEQ